MKKSGDPAFLELGKVVKELEATKRLLVLLLVKLGSSTDEIGIALGVAGQTVRKMMPTSQIRKLTVAEGAAAASTSTAPRKPPRSSRGGREVDARD